MSESFTAGEVSRVPTYFHAGSNELFGWYHHAPGTAQQNCVAVICNPVGYEYAHCHRSIRHLADRLANCGVPTMRFDYSGTGDSPGNDTDPDRIDNWINDIEGAASYARLVSEQARVCLIGIRFGATLAAFAAERILPEALILWNPCVSGRRFLRELQVIASASAGNLPEADENALESAGFVFAKETVLQLAAIDMLDLPFSGAGEILLLSRDDVAPDSGFVAHLKRHGASVDFQAVPGYAGMVAEPQFTILPVLAFDAIAAWLSARTTPAKFSGSVPETLCRSSIEFKARAIDGETLHEEICSFGERRQLFGILTKGGSRANRPAIVLFNAGCVHHVGPNRLYVTLARALADAGFSTFRFDLESIGDSVLQGPGRENHPYPDNAVADARAALAYLKQHFGLQRFILIGLCSGAHTAFHTALQEDVYSVNEAILINPLTFQWVEGMSLETVKQFGAVARYKKSVFSAQSWWKLLSGNVHLSSLFTNVWRHSITMVRARLHIVREMLFPHLGTRLSKQIRYLISVKRPLTLVIAEGEPGRDLMMAEAPYIANLAHQRGEMVTHHISGADHTFSRSGPRRQLIDYLCESLLRRYPDRPSS